MPSIINSVQVAKKRAVLKESLQLISSIVQAGVLNGDFSNITTFDIENQNGPGSITHYFTSKLNAKQCVKSDGSKDLLSKGCDRAFNNATSGDAVNHYGKWILPNGVRISFANQYWTNVHPISFHIMTDAYSTYDLSELPEKRTVFTFHCNITDTPSPREGDSTLTKPGMCQPFSSTQDILTSKALGLT